MIVTLIGAAMTGMSPAQQDGDAPPQSRDEQEGGIEVATPDPRLEAAEPLDADWFLLGRWGGWRSDLASQGITFDIQWTQSFQSIVDGGRDTGFKYGGSLDYVIDLNLDQMGVMPGAFVTLLAESRYGESVNPDAGTILGVNTDLSFPLTDDPDENIAITVTELTYTQFLSEQFGVFLGKFQTLDGDANEFASGRGRSQFMNASFVFNPVTVLTVPYSTVGGGVVWIPSDNVMVTSVLFNTNDSSTTTGFGDFGDGWTWSTEASFQYRLGDMPGGQVVTFIYADDNNFLNFSRTDLVPGGVLIGLEDDSWAFTWSAWQYVYAPDGTPERIDTSDGLADVRGLGLFARVGVADDDTNPIDLSIGGGIGGRGLIPGRDDDTFGVGFTYADFDTGALASAAGFADDAWAFEAFYNLDLDHGIWLTGDVQVIDPVTPGVDTTTILGARLNVRFLTVETRVSECTMDTKEVIESVRSGNLAVVEDNPHYRIFDCTVKHTPAFRMLGRSSGSPITLGQPMLEFMETPPLHEFADDHGIARRDNSPVEIYVYNWVERAQGPMVFDVGIPVNDAFELPANDCGFIVKDYPAMKVASLVYEGPFPHEPMSGWGRIDWERRASGKGLVYTERVYRELYHAFDFEGGRHITEIRLEIE